MGRHPDDDAADPDVTLTRAAQAGDVAAFALLLERHRAGMRAVALSILGPGPDVDDVLQDAALAALRGIEGVRDPGRVGAWLRMIVRNLCRKALLSARSDASIDALAPLPGTDAGPEELLDQHAMRDWMWEAVEQLSPTLRVPLVLRHFTEGVTGYERIAQVCGVPVGTVRSRLSQARTKLVDALAATADTAHSDVRARTEASWDEAYETLAMAESGDFEKLIADRWTPEIALMSGTSRLAGRDELARGMEADLAAGVRQRPVNVVAARSLAVWEMDLISPADDPHHCPPGVAWIMTLSGGRVAQLRLFHSQPV